jgi:protein O-GlcNAc transferase
MTRKEQKGPPAPTHAAHAAAASETLRRRLAAALEAHRRGAIEAARTGYRAVLQAEPGNVDALRLLVQLCVDTGALNEGIDLSGRALALRPDDPDGWFTRGNLLQRAGALEESVACYREALGRRPGFPEALNNLAAALRALRRLDEAQASADQALTQRPAYPRALNNRGLIALDTGRGMAAVEDFRHALALEPRFPEALHNLGTALMQLRRYAEAREAYAGLAPDFPHALGNVLFAKLCDCDWAGLDALSAAVTAAVERGAHAATPMSFLCMSGLAELQLRCARAYAQAFYPPVGAATRRPAGGKIRIGYLSGDLGEHAVSYLLAGVFERHDRTRFDTFAFAWGRRGEGEIRGRLERAFTRFIAVDYLADAAVAGLMRELGIDIAVDLCGHTEGQRTGILAQRAAPIQVNFLGLPATMGAPYIDYLIADRFLIPEDREQAYAERIVRLDLCFQPNDDRRPSAPPSASRAALGLPAGGLVLCSFNRNCKLHPTLFAAWTRLLQALPDAVLWLLAPQPAAAHHLRCEAAARGVAPQRLVFADEVAYPEYLARYRQADLFLDTAPFNGGTTVSDALSMGVPVVTLAGESFASRMAGTILQALGLSELVTFSLADYEATALALARDPGRLRELRARLDQARREHPFFDTDRYRMQLEAAYAHMASRHAAGLPPASFAVAPGAGAVGASPDQPAAEPVDKRSSGPT